MSLSEGANTVTVTVSNGTATQEYSVVVVRYPAALVWLATLGVGDASDGDGYNYTHFSDATLEPTLIDLPAGGQADVHSLFWDPTGTQLTFRLFQRGGLAASDLPGDYVNWTLHIGGQAVAMSNFIRKAESNVFIYTWNRFSFADITRPARGTDVPVCITTDGSGCPDVSPEPAEAIWSATMTVGDGTGYDGYCVGGCSEASKAHQLGATTGSMTGRTFTIPGTSTEVEVRAITWGEASTGLYAPDFNHLYVRFLTTPAKSVYEGWAISVAGVEAVNFSDATLSGGIFDFAAYFTDTTRPAAGTMDVPILIVPAGNGGGTTTPEPAEAIWSAMLTVGLASGGQANDGDAGFRTGSSNANIGGVDNAAFDVPGVSPTVEATVSRLDWTVASGTLTLELTLPATFTGYGNWTLHVGDDQAAFAGVTPSTLSGGRFGFEFSAFFSGTPPESGMLKVCITSGNADCDDSTTTPEPAEPIWSATMTVADSSGGLGYSVGLDGEIGGSLSPGATFTPPSGSEATVDWLAFETFFLTFSASPLSEGALDGYFLHFGDGSGAFSDATATADGTGYRFNWTTPTFFTGTRPADGDTGVVVCITTDENGCGSSGPSGTQAPGDGLQARFGPALAWHTGMAFWTELHFSAEPKLGYRDVRDKVLDISGGRIARAQRLTEGSNAGWRLQIVPDGWGDIALTLPPTTDCAAEGAVCTKEGEPLAQGIDLSVPGPGDRLAARLTNFSAEHTGDPFEAELSFSHEPNVGYRDVRDTVFEVTGAQITRARRVVQGSNRGWGLVVEPAGLGDVTITLPETQDCDDTGAVCTRDGARLEQGFSVTILGPTAFSVSDAEATEEPGAALAFEVSLNRPLRDEARVDVATRDGTATAGADYVALSQTLVFAPGETLKTVEVTVLDDAHDEGTEEMTLVLSNATGAQIDDAEGAGSITNSDAIPKAWLARFGRTVTSQVLDAVEDRLAAPRQAAMRARLAGQALPLSASETADDLAAASQNAALRTLGARSSATDPSGAPVGWTDRDGPLHLRGRTLTGQDVLTGTAFTLTGQAGAGDDAYVSLWGRAMVSGFHGDDDGLALDGRVTTSLLGVDWATEGWTAGLSFGHSVGSGGYQRSDCGADGACGGAIEASLTGLYPYAGFNLSERLSLWLAAGLGAGRLTVHPHGIGALATDLGLGMGALGMRSEVLGSASGALRLTLKGDARFTRTWSEAVSGPHGNLASADADVWLVRAGIEGSRRFALGASASLIPSLEIGVRRDGGDAETGFGADVGVGLALADVQRGLRLDLRMRALAAHEAAGFRDWGASAALSFDPRPASDRGLSMTLRQVWGASPSGGMEALLRRDTLTGLAPPGAAAGRLEATLSYGVPVFGGALTGAPSAGVGVSETSRDYRVGWRLTPAAQRAVPFEVNLDATRRESALSPAADHGVMLRGRVSW